MKAFVVDKDALDAISPQSLKAYASFEGWSPVEQFGKHSFVYGKNGTEAIIPATAMIGDYANVVLELVRVFSQSEERGEYQVYQDLLTSDKDVVRVRLPTAQANGSVDIDSGVDLVVHSRDLMLSAACSAWNPQPSYRAGRVRKADEYINRVRLGQTERGSFIVTLLAPVPPSVINVSDQSWPKEDEEPYDRLVTRKLKSGLDAAASSIEKYNLGADIRVFENSIRQGLSSNLCEAAAKLSARDSSVEISVTWAKTRRTPEARWMRTFSKSEGEMLLEVARVFRERQPRPDEHIEGIITKLARDEADFDGHLSLRAFIDGRYTSVKAQLRRDDYNVAINAFKLKRPISMNGTLERIGSRWKIVEPNNVQMSEGEDEDDAV